VESNNNLWLQTSPNPQPCNILAFPRATDSLPPEQFTGQLIDRLPGARPQPRCSTSSRRAPLATGGEERAGIDVGRGVGA